MPAARAPAATVALSRRQRPHLRLATVVGAALLLLAVDDAIAAADQPPNIVLMLIGV
jgi:hypothetical protein